MKAPLFSWRHPADRDRSEPWTFTLMRSSGELVQTARVAHVRLQLQERLMAGDYVWTVSYRRGDGKTTTSSARRFTVPDDASSFLPPTGEEFAAQVMRKPRPRVLPVGASFSSISAKAGTGPYAERYATLLQRTRNLIDRTIPTEPPAPDASRDSPEYHTWKQGVDAIVRKEHENIDLLSYAWRFSGDDRLKQAALARVLEFTKWSPTGGTSYETNNLANGEIALALSVGLDVLDGELSEEQRKDVVASIRLRLAPTISHFAVLDTKPYDSHNVELVKTALVALLSSAGTFPESESWLAEAWDTYISTISMWGGDDGSWGEGGYIWNMLPGLARTVASVRLVTGIDLTEIAWVRRVGDSFIAGTAPAGNHKGPFGDDADDTEVYSRGAKDSYRLYAALTRLPQHSWYWSVGEAATPSDALIHPLHYMLLGLDQPEVTPSAPTTSSFMFAEAGTVAMHDDVARTDRTSLHFRSSRFGSYSHSHADQNSFTFISKGRDLLITGGYYTKYLSPHHATVTRATRYKNALTFDGGIGQAEPTPNPDAPGRPMSSMDARGELVKYEVNGDWTVATGDATLAYRGWDDATGKWKPLLSNAVRTVGFNRQVRVAVIYDWATSDSVRNWELNFNGLEPFKVDGMGAKVTNQASSACIDVYGVQGNFSTSQGFDFAPEDGGTYPEQYQARYHAGSANRELVAVTVIRESCQSLPIEVSTSGTVATVSINGRLALKFDGRTVLTQ